MNAALRLLLLIFLPIICLNGNSATNAVVAGMDVQAAIDSAAAGDTLLFEPNTYPGASLTINKSLNLVSAGGQIRFTGSVTIQGPTTNNFQSVYFGGPVQSTGATVGFFDSTFNAPVTIAGGKAVIKRSTLNFVLTLTNNASLEALRMTTVAPINALATPNSTASFVAVQSVFYQAWNLANYSVWLGYNYGVAGCQLMQTNCHAVLIGNKIVNSARYQSGLVLAHGGSLKAFNTAIVASWSQDSFYPALVCRSNTVDMVNCTVILSTFYASTTFVLEKASGTINLKNSIFISKNFAETQPCAIYADATSGPLVFASNCDFWAQGRSSTISGIVPPLIDCLLVDPNITDFSNPIPAANSPCIGAGIDLPVYKNRDGTRNTMGYTGGPYYNPANYTENNPMVFLLAGPQSAVKGVQTSIPITAAASAGHLP
jgi:hypothetical protein